MATQLAAAVDRDPIRVRLPDVLISGVRIGPGDDVHAELAAAGDQISEWVGVAEPAAAVMKGDPRGIKSHASTGAETSGIGVGAFEVVEPELKIELAGVIFNESELRPAHGAIDPAWFGAGGRALGFAEPPASECRGAQPGACFEKRSPGHR